MKDQVAVNVPDGEAGDWKVETFEVTEQGASSHNMRCAFQPGMSHRTIEPGIYKRLTYKGDVMMSNTPAEISDHTYFVYEAKGEVLINGLGLGVALSMLLADPKKDGRGLYKNTEPVTHVTVIENSEDVIKLVAPTFKDDPRVTIIHADAFTWLPPKGKKYDAVWHDIWLNISADNLPEITKLHRKYGRRTRWQGSWCKELCRMYA